MNIAGLLKGLGLGDLVEKGAKAIDDLVVTEKELEMERIRSEFKKVEAEVARDRAQIEVNRVEAGHRSIWVAGWRPFIGWCCGAGILYIALISPAVEQLLGYPKVEVDGGLLLALVGTLLGNAGLRTYEKAKGIATGRG